MKNSIYNSFNFNNHTVFLIQSVENTYLLYAPTLRKLFRITENLAADICKDGILNDSKNININELYKILFNALDNPIEPYPMHSRKPNRFNLAIGLTRDCTLGCLYCHADAGKRGEISKEILDGSIEYAFQTAISTKLLGINFSFAVGGEPTANYNLFTYCVDKIRNYENKYEVPVYLSITTNGYYDNKKRNYLVKNFDNILLSLDGTPEIQNLHRPSKNNKESFSIVKETASYFIKHAKTFSIRATVSNYSVKKLPEIVKYFYSEFGNNFGLVFEPLVPIGRALENTNLLSEPSQSEFVNAYILAKQFANEFGIKLNTSASNHNRLVTSFCGAMSLPSYVVTTHGILTACERDAEGVLYNYGIYDKISKSFICDISKININNKLLELPAKCNDCFCKWHCAGDCPDVKSIKYDRCYIVKSLIRYELEQKLINH